MKTNSIASVRILGVVLAAMATAAVAQVGEVPSGSNFYSHGHDVMWGGGQWGGFSMILGPIFMILVLIAIFVGVIYVLRLVGGPGSVGGSHQTQNRALAILKERFAKGEIDPKEFDERMKLLAD